MRFAILSSGPEPWGGSEELWWQAALELRRRGHSVDVLKTVVDDGHPRIRALRAGGCSVRDIDRARLHRVTSAATAVLPPGLGFDRKRRELVAVAAALAARRPALAIVSQGRNFDGGHFALACDWLRIPFVLVAQKAMETHWPSDGWLVYLRRVYGAARRCVFVSEHNRRLTERQLGIALERAVIMRNPVLVRRDGPLPWPPLDGGVRLACVARLFTAEKGQDLLLDVLARERWRGREVTVGLYGDGVNREGLTTLARRLDLGNVRFAGQVAGIEDVWRSHHALVLPSRAEGLPLSVVEAMTLGRVPIVTDVGGTAEVVEDGVTGFVAAAPTADLLDETLERAWQARDEWERIAARAAAAIAALAPPVEGSPLADLALAEAPAGQPSPRPTRRRSRYGASVAPNRAVMWPPSLWTSAPPMTGKQREASQK